MRTWLKRLELWQNGPIDVEKIRVFLPGLAPSMGGLRLLVVSDVHLGGDTLMIDQVLACASEVKPDFILCAGDLVDNHTPNLVSLEKLLRGLRAIAPVLAILGNNDYFGPDLAGMRALYKACDVLLLEDELRTIKHGDDGLRILGLQDPAAYVTRRQILRRPEAPQAASLPDLLNDTTEDGPILLLMHQPQFAPGYRHLGVALQVAGHAHGGQVRLPKVGALYAPGQGLFPKLTSGLYCFNGVQVLVSRGLGNHGCPIRIRNRPHLPLIELWPASAIS